MARSSLRGYPAGAVSSPCYRRARIPEARGCADNRASRDWLDATSALPMPHRYTFADNLAAAFLAGAWTRKALLRRGVEASGGHTHYLRTVVGKVLLWFPTTAPRPDAAVLARALDGQFGSWLPSICDSPHRIYWLVPRMMSSPWEVPPLTTTGAVAEWLGLTHGELDWFADRQHRGTRTPPGPLRHYAYHWLKGRHGKRRLLEVPKHRLKEIQRRLLHDILDCLPPHNAVHAFSSGPLGRHLRCNPMPIAASFCASTCVPSSRRSLAARVHASCSAWKPAGPGAMWPAS